MLAALAAHKPPGVGWTRPEGGFFVWLTLPAGLSGAALLQRAVNEARVVFMPGAGFLHDSSGENTIRLSNSLPSPVEIATSVERLAALLPRDT